MPLPGSLCMGILEEDNPQKSYFRIKPLLILGENGFEPFTKSEEFPEEGCIRIVPDKNESSHFKTRMRRMGKYAVLDLREHTGENEKIRPNKNYGTDPSERNAQIVYSDVVIEPIEGAVMEILEAPMPAEEEFSLNMPLPGSESVLLRAQGGGFSGVWRAQMAEDAAESVKFTRVAGKLSFAGAKEYSVEGFRGERLCFLLAPFGETFFVREEGENVEKPQQIPAVENRVRLIRARLSETAENIEPPLRVHTAGLREQAVMQQAGLNPRRGRSLQEIIEDKWRHSRIDQLGHPVPARATGQPFLDPVETAIEAVRHVWQKEALRAQIIRGFSEISELEEAVIDRATDHAETLKQARLNELEAQRLKLLDEIGDLEQRRSETKKQLIAELRAENASGIAEDQLRADALRNEIQEYEKAAELAQKAYNATQQALETLVEKEFDGKIAEHALSLRALHKGARMQAAAVKIERHRLEKPSAGELISDVRKYFQAAGMTLSNDAAVNLLACFTLSPITIFSGPVGSGKTATVRRLVEALGLTGCGRYQELRPRGPGMMEPPVLDALKNCPDRSAPLVAMIDDANCMPMEETVHAAMLEINRADRNPQLRVLLTVQDNCMSMRLGERILDRAFLVRLRCASADSAWEPMCNTATAPDYTVSADALQAIFTPRPQNVADSVRDRVAKLRADMGEKGVTLSRRTLDALWNYIACVTPLMREHTPMEVLDLALAQRVLPIVATGAPMEALHALKKWVEEMPICLAMLKQPLPVLV